MGLLQRIKDRLGARHGEPGLEDMTLGQLVVLAAASPAPEVRDALYGRLLFSKVGIRAPGSPGSGPAGAPVLGEKDRITIRPRKGSHGKSYLEVFCDVPALRSETPDQTVVELDARVVLDMAQSHGAGVLCQSSAGGRNAWIAIPREDVAGILAGRYSHAAAVPSEHRVAVVRASPVAYFAQKESGVWIADLGRGGAQDAVLSHVRREVEKGEPMRIVWILEPVVLENPAEIGPVVAALDLLVESCGDTVTHSVVVPYGSGRHQPMMDRLKQAGARVHFGGPQGECLVEVHRPDGITVDLPGREL